MDKKEDVAGASQQFLPGTARSLIAAGPSRPPLSRSAHAGAAAELEVSPQQTMLRLGEVIAREIRMFKRGGDDFVEVILTPNLKTQIALRLHWREGQVAVQAWCDRGDHASLALLWPQLQAHLADYHVRLAGLINRTSTGYTEFFQGDPMESLQMSSLAADRPAAARPLELNAASLVANQPPPVATNKSLPG